MRKSIATVSLSGTLPEKLAAAAQAGFDGVEIFENDLIHCPLAPEAVARQAADLGLSIDLYQPLRDVEAVPQDLLKRNLRRAERKFELMRRLGATLLLVCSNVSADAADDDALAAEQLYALAELAREYGVSVAYEALAWGRHVNDYRHAHRIVAVADHPHLGVCLDSFHILARGADPAAIREIPSEKIFFLQLADAPRLSMDMLQWSRHYRCFPGQGGFDVAAFTEHVLAAGYGGPLSLEIFNDVFRQADSACTAEDAMRSLLRLEELLRHRITVSAERGDGDAARTRERVELFTPPAPVDLLGHAFAEIDTGGEAGEVRAALEGLGFAMAGRHHTKDAELWQHGGARVVLNHENDRRPRLAAAGLHVSDPARAAARAEKFRAHSLPRRGDPAKDEPAMFATASGMAVIFCSGQGWQDDFELSADIRSDLLTGIDHIALPVSFDRFDEESLLLSAVLGVHPAESFELAEPYGLMRSRAFTAPAGEVRIALNTPLLGTRMPVTTQHIAFTTRDALAAARALHAGGLRTLPIPDNYYDDLIARWDLDEGYLAELRKFGILYDRDMDGEFLHFYSRTVGGGLFFEVVQRSGDYHGFGASNAAVRIAAQLHDSEENLMVVSGVK
jgi:4-hydroxyphenylpyruvate dioxygenase